MANTNINWPLTFCQLQKNYCSSQVISIQKERIFSLPCSLSVTDKLGLTCLWQDLLCLLEQSLYIILIVFLFFFLTNAMTESPKDEACQIRV